MSMLDGKKVLITGAAMGMGKLHAQRAVKEGAAAVVLWDIDAEALAATARELKQLGGADVRSDQVDVSSVDEIVAAAERVRRDVGRIDVLINNAGIVRGKLFWEHDHQRDIRSTMAINALAPMHITREFLPAMIESKEECHIVNIASASGFVSVPRMSVYVASKWAAVGWSDSLRLELVQAGHAHVKVTTVCPSYVSTGMFAGAKGPLLTPMLTPEHVVDGVWTAMQHGRPYLLQPWTVHLSMALKGLLPTGAWDVLAGRVFGVYDSMKQFVGHGSEPPQLRAKP